MIYLQRKKTQLILLYWRMGKMKEIFCFFIIFQFLISALIFLQDLVLYCLFSIFLEGFNHLLKIWSNLLILSKVCFNKNSIKIYFLSLQKYLNHSSLNFMMNNNKCQQAKLLHLKSIFLFYIYPFLRMLFLKIIII